MARIKILTRKEFCELTGIKPATLRKYLSKDRRLLVESAPGEINVFNTKNQNWIVDYCDKNGIDYTPIFAKSEKKDIPQPKKSVQSILVDSKLKESSDIDKEVKIELTERSQLNKDKLKRELYIKDIEAQLKKLDLEKKKAKIVPTDFIIEVFSTYIKTNITGINNEVNKLFDELIDKFDGDYELKLAYKKRTNSLINEIFKNNHEIISKDIIARAKEYALNRNW